MIMCTRCHTPSCHWIMDPTNQYMVTKCAHCGGNNTDVGAAISDDDGDDYDDTLTTKTDAERDKEDGE